MNRLSQTCTTLLLAGVLGFAASAQADERPDHFEGKASATVAEALTNLREHHPQLQALLAKDNLDARDLYQVHQLTYTLENALERLASELERSAEMLENVHVASENNDADTVREEGRQYLNTIRPFLAGDGD